MQYCAISNDCGPVGIRKYTKIPTKHYSILKTPSSYVCAAVLSDHMTALKGELLLTVRLHVIRFSSTFGDE